MSVAARCRELRVAVLRHQRRLNDVLASTPNLLNDILSSTREIALRLTALEQVCLTGEAASTNLTSCVERLQHLNTMLRDRVIAFRTLDELLVLLDQGEFGRFVADLRALFAQHDNPAAFARAWASALLRGEAWAHVVDHCRETCLEILDRWGEFLLSLDVNFQKSTVQSFRGTRALIQCLEVFFPLEVASVTAVAAQTDPNHACWFSDRHLLDLECRNKLDAAGCRVLAAAVGDGSCDELWFVVDVAGMNFFPTIPRNILDLVFAANLENLFSEHISADFQKAGVETFASGVELPPVPDYFGERLSLSAVIAVTCRICGVIRCGENWLHGGTESASGSDGERAVKDSVDAHAIDCQALAIATQLRAHRQQAGDCGLFSEWILDTHPRPNGNILVHRRTGREFVLPRVVLPRIQFSAHRLSTKLPLHAALLSHDPLNSAPPQDYSLQGYDKILSLPRDCAEGCIYLPSEPPGSCFHCAAVLRAMEGTDVSQGVEGAVVSREMEGANALRGTEETEALVGRSTRAAADAGTRDSDCTSKHCLEAGSQVAKAFGPTKGDNPSTSVRDVSVAMPLVRPRGRSIATADMIPRPDLDTIGRGTPIAALCVKCKTAWPNKGLHALSSSERSTSTSAHHVRNKVLKHQRVCAGLGTAANAVLSGNVSQLLALHLEWALDSAAPFDPVEGLVQHESGAWFALQHVAENRPLIDEWVTQIRAQVLFQSTLDATVLHMLGSIPTQRTTIDSRLKSTLNTEEVATPLRATQRGDPTRITVRRADQSIFHDLDERIFCQGFFDEHIFQGFDERISRDLDGFEDVTFACDLSEFAGAGLLEEPRQLRLGHEMSPGPEGRVSHSDSRKRVCRSADEIDPPLTLPLKRSTFVNGLKPESTLLSESFSEQWGGASGARSCGHFGHETDNADSLH